MKLESITQYRKPIIIILVISCFILCLFYPVGDSIHLKKRFYDLYDSISSSTNISRYQSVTDQFNSSSKIINMNDISATETNITLKNITSKYWNPIEWSQLYNNNVNKNNTRYFAPVNASSVNYVNNDKLLCSENGKNLKLLMGIKTYPGNFKARSNIRETWGARAFKMGVKVLFIVGTLDSNTTKLIQLEKEKNNDIIEGEFQDSYYNLTLKSMLFYKWTITYCSLVKHVVKLDDDVIVNIPKLLDNINKIGPMNAAGYVWRKNGVGRLSSHKWFIPKYYYPWSNYPNFLSGTFIVLGMECVRALYKASQSTPYFNLDDVYETGMLTIVGKVVLMDWKGLINFYQNNGDMCGRIAFIQTKREMYLDIWKRLISKKNNCEQFW